MLYRDSGSPPPLVQAPEPCSGFRYATTISHHSGFHQNLGNIILHSNALVSVIPCLLFPSPVVTCSPLPSLRSPAVSECAGVPPRRALHSLMLPAIIYSLPQSPIVTYRLPPSPTVPHITCSHRPSPAVTGSPLPFQPYSSCLQTPPAHYFLRLSGLSSQVKSGVFRSFGRGQNMFRRPVQSKALGCQSAGPLDRWEHCSLQKASLANQ